MDGTFVAFTSHQTLWKPQTPKAMFLSVAPIDLVLMDGDVDRFIANGGGGIVGLVWILATIVPALAVLVRRLHDTGKSGWWALMILLPVAGAIVLLVFTVTDSDGIANKYGVSPKLPL